MLLLALVVPELALADSVAAPPQFYRSWRVTAATASAAKSLLLTVSGEPAAIKVTVNIAVTNEDTVAGETAYFRLDRDSVSPTANATEIDQDPDIPIEPGETINFDGQFRGIAYIRKTGDVPLRFVAGYK